MVRFRVTHETPDDPAAFDRHHRGCTFSSRRTIPAFADTRSAGASLPCAEASPTTFSPNLTEATWSPFRPHSLRRKVAPQGAMSRNSRPPGLAAGAYGIETMTRPNANCTENFRPRPDHDNAARHPLNSEVGALVSRAARSQSVAQHEPPGAAAQDSFAYDKPRCRTTRTRSLMIDFALVIALAACTLVACSTNHGRAVRASAAVSPGSVHSDGRSNARTTSLPNGLGGAELEIRPLVTRYLAVLDELYSDRHTPLGTIHQVATNPEAKIEIAAVRRARSASEQQSGQTTLVKISGIKAAAASTTPADVPRACR